MAHETVGLRPSVAQVQQTASSTSLSLADRAKRLPLHYPLTHEEWLKSVHELKPAERDVLYYIRTIDPFGNQTVELKVREIARQLGRDASTVSRALKVLEQKGWIDMELLQVQVKLKPKGNVSSG